MSGARAQARLDALAKPPGSLGRLEKLAARLAETQGREDPRAAPRRLVVFAGDHGVVAEGIGLWPSEVTTAMMRLIRAGRSSSAALARASGTEVVLVDAGSRTPLDGEGELRVGPGTGNLAHGPAMEPAHLEAALALGARTARQAAADGIAVLALGEMGIGNTTAAACLTALLTGASAEAVVGPGAGATPETLARKRAVVRQAVERARPLLRTNPRAAIAAVAGFEIVAIAGCITEAARLGITVVLDGFVVGAGALVAQALEPDSLRAAIAAHRSAEPGHAVVLAALGLDPFLEWELRLGEGTGALLLLPMLDAAAALLRDVSTLEEAVGG
jgi:nicotinate-nucleotide--dimethylbenzimidazole phosphoribosyltransferase